MTAKGLFRATGKVAKPVVLDMIDGVAVMGDAPREKDDFYPTPPEPTRALLNAEKQHIAGCAIWEPAAGDGAMAAEIAKAGHSVFCSDLIDRNCNAEIKSFYDYKSPPQGHESIITNPPFKECNSGEWIRHALEVLRVPYMALLLPLNWPGAASRAALWQKHPPARVYLMQWRIDFTGKGAPPMLNCWFVWTGNTNPDETRFLMLGKEQASETQDLFKEAGK